MAGYKDEINLFRFDVEVADDKKTFVTKAKCVGT